MKTMLAFLLLFVCTVQAKADGTIRVIAPGIDTTCLGLIDNSSADATITYFSMVYANCISDRVFSDGAESYPVPVHGDIRHWAVVIVIYYPSTVLIFDRNCTSDSTDENELLPYYLTFMVVLHCE